MKKSLSAASLAFLLIACFSNSCRAATSSEAARWRHHAASVTIVRDDWGIAHVHGKTDADAAFGMIYAQAEDDFNRVETNYLNAMGRLAEAEGEQAIWQDLRMKLFIRPDELKSQFAASPAWLRVLMVAWADGLNYFLATHPKLKPRVISRFEPWMALSFSEGSIGGDIESVSLDQLQAFYGRPVKTATAQLRSPLLTEPTGSNGFAIAPGNTTAGHALLLINPHTSFFFRSELQTSSDEGLNAYGAVTWGQFFLYQGFNDRLGWMHTSSGVDVIDEFIETIIKTDKGLYYRYGKQRRPVVTSIISVPFRGKTGGMDKRVFRVFRTHHGPIVRAQDGNWISVALMARPVEALSQSYLLTKARDRASFMKVMALKANSSNNTIYADADGNIAYLHPQFIPRRDDRFDYTKPVDGSDPATDWNGLHALDEAPALLNPGTGWIQNTNNWPYSAAGKDSPKRENFPRYMDMAGENPRGVNALRVLDGKRDFSLDSLVSTAYDPYLPFFARLIPALVEDYEGTPGSNPLKARLAGQVQLLRDWDCKWAIDSPATALAVYWATDLSERSGNAYRESGLSAWEYLITRTTSTQKLQSLAAAADKLQADFGSWRIAWGEINRLQRLSGDIVQPFDDSAPSLPVGFVSGNWGSLASFGGADPVHARKFYGSRGNSFVAVVEFGEQVRARAISSGGESGDPASPHFNDQAMRYSVGDLREVYFYPAQLMGHTERSYHPGQ